VAKAGIGRVIAAVAASLLLIILISCHAEVPTPQQPTDIKIGCVLSMTGPLSTMSIMTLNAARLAIDQINTAGGVKEKRVTLLVQDYAGDPAASLSAVKKLVQLNGVKTIIGVIEDAAVAASRDYVSRQHAVLVLTSARLPQSGEQARTRWVLCTCPSDALEGKVLADMALEKGFTKIAILFVNNAYGAAVQMASVRTLEGKAKVVSVGYDPVLPQEYYDQLSHIKNEGPECVLHIGFSAINSIPIYIQALKMGLHTVQWFATSRAFSHEMLTDPKAAEFISQALIGIWLDAPEEDPVWIQFCDSYRRVFNTEPNVYSAFAYDAMKLLASAIAEAGTYDGTMVRDALLEVGEDYPGASGHIAFNDNGDRVTGRFAVLKVERDENTYTIRQVGRRNGRCWPHCED